MLAGVLLATTFVVAPVAVPSASAAGIITLLEKNVAPTTTLASPALPGTVLTYTISYDCSGINIGDNCDGAVITDALPTFTDIYGAVQQLDFVSGSASVPGDWTFQGVSGAEPTATVSWVATANLEAGDSGAVILELRVPNGVVPSYPVAQRVDNSATVVLAGQSDGTVGPAISYINAQPEQSDLSKSGPASALLNAAGTDPISHTISICATSTHALSQEYDVTDTLPVGATVVSPGSLPFGGVYTPGTPSTWTPPVPPATEPTITPGTGGTIVWHLDPVNRPAVDANGCMAITFQVSYQNAAAGGDLTNEVGASKTNSVSAVATGPNQDLGPATTTLTLNGPVTRFSPSKSTGGNYYVQNGDTVVYNLGASNSSDAEAVPFSDATLSDGPFPAEFTLTEIRTGTWTGSSDAVGVSVETSPDGTSWTVVATAPSTTITAGLTGVRYVRWVFTSTGAPAIGPGWSATGQRLTGTVAGSPPPSVIATNCASLTGVQAGVLQNRGQACADVVLETPQPHGEIAKSSPSTLEPGETITYTLTASNNSDATGALINPQLTDCVPDSDHLVVSNLRANGVALPSNGWSVEAGPTLHGCTPTQPSTANSGTFIQLQYTGSVAPGAAAPVITYDVTADSFHLPAPADTPVLPGTYTNTVAMRDSAGNPFAHCVQASCEASNSVTVPVTADLRSNKLVKGELDNGFNKAGTTTAGGRVTWRIEVQNVGNVNVDQVQYVDIFGYVGDTGVRRTDQNRGSEFAPYLTSPINAPSGWTVEYSLTNNPCRPEVLGPNSGCVAPNWTTAPNLLHLPDYRSVRFTFSGLISVGDTLAVEWNMATPVFDPSYDSPSTSSGPYDALASCTIPESSPPYPGGDPGNSTLVGSRTEVAAWVDANADGVQQAGEGGPTCPRSSNSFAYGVHVPADQLNGLPDPGRLGAEPPKVDVHVAAAPPPNSIGSRVWNDANNDGLQGATATEPGIPSVRVDLFNDSGALLQTTFTDQNGDYSFDQLPDGKYFVRFYMPDSRGYISPQDASGLPIDVGAANTDNDSDIPETPSGTDAGANYYDTVIVWLGNDISQSEADPSWDAGIWIPNPSISLKKYVNGNDAQTTPGPNIPRGNAVTWTYDVENTGNTYLKNVTLVDDVTISTEADPVPVCNWAGSSNLVTPAGVLSPGETVSCTASGTAIRGQYGNNATVTGTPTLDDGVTAITGKVDANGTPLPTTVSDSDPAHYFGVEYDLALAKTANVSTVVQGGTVVWTIRVDNQGNVGSGNYTVTDSIPAGLTFVSSVPSPTSTSGRTLTFNQTNLAAGGTRNITITTTVSDINMRPFVNWAEISADSAASSYNTTDWDSVPNTNIGDDAGAGPLVVPGSGVGLPDDQVVDNTSTSVAIPDTVPNDEDDNDYAAVTGNVVYDLALVKTVAPTPLVGADGLATWTITIKNQGNLASGTYSVTDRLPAGLTYLGSNRIPATISGRLYTWVMPNLAAGATTTITVNTQVNDQSMKPFVNWAEISSDSASDYSTIVSTVTDADSTPDAFVGDDPGAGSGTGPTNSGGTPEPNIDRTSNSDVNTDIVGDEDDSDQAVLNSDILYDLALVKTVDASPVQPDDTITWTITVKNQGNVPSHAYTVTDHLADGLTFATAVPAATATAGQDLTWDMPNLAAGATATIVITTTIDDVNKRPFRNWAEISDDSASDYATVDDDSTPDTNVGNDDVAGTGTPPNDVFVDQTVLPVAQHNDKAVDEDDNDLAEVALDVAYDLAVAKVADVTSIDDEGDAINYTVTVANQGNLPSRQFTVVDTIPAGLTAPTAITGGGVWSAGARTITWTVANLAVGDTQTFTYTVTVGTMALPNNVWRNLVEIATDSSAFYGVSDIDSTPGGGATTHGVDNTGPGAILQAGTGGDAGYDDEDIAVVTSGAIYDLALAKTNVVTGTGADTNIDYEILVENQGTLDSRAYTVLDIVPPGLVVDEASISDGGVYDAGAGTITWSLTGLLPFDPPRSLTWSATVGDFSLRPYRNYAEISQDGASTYGLTDIDSVPDADNTNDTELLTYDDDGVDNLLIGEAGNGADPEDDADIADANVSLTYDLALAKVPSATSVSPSGTVTFTVVVENQGDVNSGDFTVTDTLPAGTLATAASDGGTITATTVTWHLTNLDPGETRTVTVTVAISDASKRPFKNIAEISADGADEYDSEVPFLGSDVEDIDSIPDATTTNDNGLLPDDGYGIFEAPLNDLDGIADVDSIANGEDDADVAFFDVPVLYDLALVKTGPAEIDGAGTATFTIEIKNQGTVASGNYTVLDTVPAGLAAVSASNGGTIAGQSVTWNLSGLAAGATTSVTVTVRVTNFASRPWVNIAEISADGADSYDSTGYQNPADGDVEDDDSIPDANPSNDALIDQTVLPTTQHNDPAVDSDDHDVAPIDVAIVYDLALVKNLPGGQSYAKGSNITFILQIKNQGNVDSGAYSVHDVLPAGLTFVSATDNPLVAGQSLTWDLPSMAPGGVKSITIVVQIVDVTLASYVNLAEIVTDGADTYDAPGKDVEDKDSTPDADLNNDPLVDTDDVNIDHIPGDEDDHDRAMLDPAKVASDNPVTGRLPSTGSDAQPLVFTAAGLLGAGALALLVTRRRRRRTSAA